MALGAIARHGEIANFSDSEAAYIAGMIDADGTITATRKADKLPAPMVLVVNTDWRLICWLKSTIGAGCSYETKTRPTRPDQNEAHWNKVHRFQITGWKAISLIERVRPYMIVKVAHADWMMTMACRGRDFQRFATDEQLERSVRALSQLRFLNQRGKKQSYQSELVL
jgi:hypothetical protein